MSGKKNRSEFSNTTWDRLIDLGKIIIPIITIVLGYLYDSCERREWEQYQRKEINYRGLISSAQGFETQNLDPQKINNFIQELRLSWLYASDEVIRKGYNFLSTVREGVQSNDKIKEEALGTFILAIRKDILSGETINKTSLTHEDYKLFMAREK